MDRDLRCVLKAAESAAKREEGKVKNVLRLSKSPTRSLISSSNYNAHKDMDIRRWLLGVDFAHLTEPSINDHQMFIMIIGVLCHFIQAKFQVTALSFVFLHLSQYGIFLKSLLHEYYVSIT